MPKQELLKAITLGDKAIFFGGIGLAYFLTVLHWAFVPVAACAAAVVFGVVSTKKEPETSDGE